MQISDSGELGGCGMAGGDGGTGGRLGGGVWASIKGQPRLKQTLHRLQTPSDQWLHELPALVNVLQKNGRQSLPAIVRLEIKPYQYEGVMRGPTFSSSLSKRTISTVGVGDTMRMEVYGVAVEVAIALP